MKQYKFKIILIGFCILLILVIFSRNVVLRVQEDQQATVNETNYVTHAKVAKMISLLQYTKDELQEMERTITYTDVQESDWYDLYINGLATMGYASDFGEKEKFLPNDCMTYKECTKLLKQMEKKEKKDIINQLSISFKVEDEKVTNQDWLEIYQYIRSNILVDEEGKSLVTQKEVYVIDTYTNNDELQDWTMVTDTGLFGIDGYDYNEYLDYTIKAYVNGSEIVYVENVVSREHALENIWIIKNDGNDVSVFINGVTRVFHASSEIREDLSSTVADLVIENQNITKINLKPDMITGKVLAATKDYIELEEYGKLELEDSYKIYKIYDEVMMEVSNAILVGYQNTNFVVSNGKICAALIKENITAKDIRVLIRNNGYKGVYHNQVEITSKKAFTITSGKTSTSYKAGTKVTVNKNSKLFKENRLVIKTEDEGKIEVSSLTRSYGHPSYRGTMEIVKNDEGFTVINELPMEEYLYAVISSEMPTKYGIEALKVQAICARSYAYQHLLANSCSQYGAHVDDSTAYQVYNNHQEDEQSIQAVNDTYGQVLENHGMVVYAYYFSTSCGYTSNVEDVWLSSKKISYLTGQYQGMKDDTYTDLSKESVFKEFITNKKLDTYDKDYPWYRWSLKLTAADVGKMVNAKLGTLYGKKKSYIQTLQEDGTYKSIPISTVGTVKEMKIKKRAKSGLVKELLIVGSKNTVKVTSESFVRQLLSPDNYEVTRNDGSKVNNLSLLPSGFFMIQTESKDGNKVFSLTGGGYGHGVGMSQNGVKGMVDAGYGYEDILKHYYNGIEIGSIY